SDRRAVEAAVAQTVACYGSLHVLFNNAGGGARDRFPAESEEVWERVLKVNLTGTFLMSQAVWPHFIAAGGGTIINMSSLAAVNGPNDTRLALVNVLPSASYYASKAGIEAFTRYSAGVGARHNIRVNCVRPGQILTPRVTTTAGEHVFAGSLNAAQMLKGPGRPDDVAHAVLFLATEESRFITAEILNIDGGAVAKV
ncbi:MAG TPA: SDR family oxidoreductase, partial [Candidatus Tectomicrobia bacterium]|nr:SDR family oxidoreductase [Candidatus Tectomicrobia bacterium]